MLQIRFNLSSGSGPIHTWRKWGTLNKPSNIIERKRFGVHGAQVLGRHYA